MLTGAAGGGVRRASSGPTQAVCPTAAIGGLRMMAGHGVDRGNLPREPMSNLNQPKQLPRVAMLVATLALWAGTAQAAIIGTYTTDSDFTTAVSGSTLETFNTQITAVNNGNRETYDYGPFLIDKYRIGPNTGAGAARGMVTEPTRCRALRTRRRAGRPGGGSGALERGRLRTARTRGRISAGCGAGASPQPYPAYQRRAGPGWPAREPTG
jgi:hypothetical protein